MKKQAMSLSREIWNELTYLQQQEMREKFDVVVAKHYYSNGEVA